MFSSLLRVLLPSFFILASVSMAILSALTHCSRFAGSSVTAVLSQKVAFMLPSASSISCSEVLKHSIVHKLSILFVSVSQAGSLSSCCLCLF
ncbi:MAG: hypothetical protein J3Q66DRAFT_331861 [Benniella sp.]|nr:MAG: hypothetical protein J3Q66DRAFT_331861 [Benniella sp.]